MKQIYCVSLTSINIQVVNIITITVAVARNRDTDISVRVTQRMVGRLGTVYVNDFKMMIQLMQRFIDAR